MIANPLSHEAAGHTLPSQQSSSAYYETRLVGLLDRVYEMEMMLMAGVDYDDPATYKRLNMALKCASWQQRGLLQLQSTAIKVEKQQQKTQPSPSMVAQVNPFASLPVSSMVEEAADLPIQMPDLAMMKRVHDPLIQMPAPAIAEQIDNPAVQIPAPSIAEKVDVPVAPLSIPPISERINEQVAPLNVSFIQPVPTLSVQAPLSLQVSTDGQVSNDEQDRDQLPESDDPIQNTLPNPSTVTVENTLSNPSTATVESASKVAIGKPGAQQKKQQEKKLLASRSQKHKKDPASTKKDQPKRKRLHFPKNKS